MIKRPIAALAIALLCAANLAANADFRSPPRYDGAGYAVLARSLLQGRGYREIDHPDAPRHAHFPPGYPLALAGLWSITGLSAAAAHGSSFACTIAATLLAWVGFRSWCPPRPAFLLALALSVNWRWGRDGAAIQSEPLFAMLSLGAWVASGVAARRGGSRRAATLGLLLGLAVLTRHVGIALAAALIADLGLRGRRREAIVAASVMAASVTPWLAWLARVRTHTQVGLVPVGGLGRVMAGNGLFYARRLIDQVLGPVVEVATVFRPAYSGWATAAAGIAAGLIVLGWARLLRAPGAREAGLIPLATLALLLAWPFTEAGRFLVPLIPFLVAGLAEGIAASGRSRTLAASLVLAVSIPYSLYAVVSGRAEAARRTNDGFDSACAWIAAHPGPAGPVLSRHPGEVFWLTGRPSIAPPEDASPDDVAAIADRYRAAFLLIDEERFALAPESPLGRFAAAHPGRVERVYRSDGDRPVVVDRLRNPD